MNISVGGDIGNGFLLESYWCIVKALSGRELEQGEIVILDGKSACRNLYTKKICLIIRNLIIKHFSGWAVLNK